MMNLKKTLMGILYLMNKKQYFNNNTSISKSLILRIDFALLGFYLCYYCYCMTKKSHQIFKTIIAHWIKYKY